MDSWGWFYDASDDNADYSDELSSFSIHTAVAPRTLAEALADDVSTPPPFVWGRCSSDEGAAEGNGMRASLSGALRGLAGNPADRAGWGLSFSWLG